MPGPHRCYTALTAVQFQIVESENVDEPILAVSSFSRFTEVLDNSPEHKHVALGDILVSIDGIHFSEYFKATQWKNGGANEFGGGRAAIDSLSFRSGLMVPMPNDNIRFTLKSPSKRHVYQVLLPWVTSAKIACLAETHSFLEKITANSTSPKIGAARLDKKNFRQLNTPINELKKSFKRRKYVFELKNTTDPIIRFGIFDPALTNLGIIVMDSFEPLNNDINALIILIRGLLVNELAETKGLVFDVRDNGGGLISMANNLPQLFKHQYENGKFRALISPLNAKLFAAGGEDDWEKAYTSAQKGDIFTPLVSFNTDASSNYYGQAYFKPVGVFTNGRCYSSCDFFAANMQDNEAAWIFGEDGTTGAGGI